MVVGGMGGVSSILFAGKERDATSPIMWNHLLLETGDDFLLESGGFILLENK